MADPAAPPSENPFAQFGPRAGADEPDAPAPDAPAAASPAPVANDNQPTNPFAEFGPKAEADPEASTTTGAFARGAEKGVVPSAAGLAGAGAGGAAVVAAGAALGTTIGPWGTAGGALAGALVGGYGGSYLQNLALSHMSDSWRDKLGLDDRQARLDEAQHGVASFLGGLLPAAVTMRPGMGELAKLPENATAMQHIMAHPATARLFGGGLGYVTQAAQDLVSQGHLDWRKDLMSTAFGVVFNRPNRIGEFITNAGERPFHGPINHPDAPPTVAQASDLNIMGPGVNENVFQGGQERAPTAAMTAQEHARVEQDALGEPPEPDLHAVARQMEPELFGQYDALVQRRNEFQAWHGEGGGAEAAERHLAATDAEIQEIAPRVSAAYRRAEETVKTEVEPPEQFKSFAEMLAAREKETGGVSRETDLPNMQSPPASPAGEGSGTVLPAVQSGEAEGVRQPVAGGGQEGVGGQPSDAGGVLGPQRSIGEQRAFIANDVAEKLVAAGRPDAEARAAAQLVAARYVTRAGRFGGKLGTPEELYAREGAAIAGPSGKALEPASAKFRKSMEDYRDGKITAPEYTAAREEMYRVRDTAEAQQKEALVQHFEQTAGLREAPSDARALDANGEGTEQSANLYQGKSIRNASITFGRGRPLIRLLKTANASSFIHESGHDFLEQMMRDAQHPDAPMDLRDDAQTIRDWLGVKDDIQTKHHEKFARGFEQYLREGVAPSQELAGVFAKFRDWLLSIYQSIKGLGTEISPEIRNVFDRMLEMEPQRTVVAPERAPGGPTIHDIHEADAAHTLPHEAGAAADRITAERTRHIQEPPPEIANEIAPIVQKIEAEQDAARANAGGEDGAGAVGSGEVEPGGGGPEPQSGVGGVGEERGKVGGGGSATSAEGGQRPESRSKLGDSPGTALAPGPTDLFGNESPFTDKAGNIRLDTLNTTDDVKQAIRDSAAANNDFIGDRRGVVTEGQVLELANDIGMAGAENLVQKHVTGQAFNAEQVVALRKLLRESAANVSTAAKKFAASGSDEDVLAFAQAKDRLQMVQKTVAGVTAEAGRALRAFRTLPGEQDTKAIEQMIAEATGKTLFQLKTEAKLAAGIDTPQKMNKFLQNVDNRSLGGMVLEAWINGLLSAPSTQIANIVSNTIFSVQHYGIERAVAAVVGGAAHAVGREGTYTRLGEVAAAAKGAAQGTAPALLAAGESFKKGSTGLLPGEEEPSSGILQGILHDDLLQRGTLDPKATLRDVQAALFATSRGVRDAIVAGGALLKAGGVEGSPFMGAKYDVQGAIPDIQIKGMNVLPLGTAVRSTGRFLATADTFAASLNYSAGISAIAYRMASDEGLTGSAFAQRVAQLRNSPTPEMMKDAAGQARQTTFMDKGGDFVRAFNSLAGKTANLPFLGKTQIVKFVAPFTNVVSRILDQTIVKRTPAGFLSPELRADLLGKNGNIAQDTAAARMMLGSSLLVAFGAMAADGYTTGSGPKDPKENAIWRLTHQAHSVKIGGAWYAVQKLGPMGMLMSMAADMHDIAHVAEEGDWGKVGATLFHAIVQNTLDQSSLQGPADLIKAVETPDQYGQQYIKGFLSSFVPESGLVNWIAKSRDPYIRETWGVLDALKAKIPGYSETLHPKIDMWGEPVPGREQLAGASGIYLQKASNDPVNKALADLGMGKGMPEKKIRNVQLTPEQYEFFCRTSGRMAKQRMDAAVRSPQWDTWNSYMKMKVTNEMIDGSRTAAEGLVFAKWPSILRQAYDDKATLIKTGKKAIH